MKSRIVTDRISFRYWLAATPGKPAWTSSMRLVETFVMCLLGLGMALAQDPSRAASAEKPVHKNSVSGGGGSVPLMIEPDSGFYFPYEYKPGGTPLVGDPLSSATGEYRNTWPLLSLGGVLPLHVSLLYAPDLFNRTVASDGPNQTEHYIRGFTTDTVYRLIEFEERGGQQQAFINVLLKDDTFVFLDQGGGQFVPDGERKLQIQRLGDYYYLSDPVTELIYIFRSRVKNTQRPFQLVRRMGEAVVIMDRNGNSLRFSYNSDNNPTLIEDGLGRRLVFSYNQDGRLKSVSDGQGRTCTFAYQNSKLASFTNPAGGVTRFEYDAGSSFGDKLKRYILPAGNAPFNQTWQQRPAPNIGWEVESVVNQTDAYQNTLTIGFDPTHDELTANFPDGTRTVYASGLARYPLRITDTEGHTASYTYDFANLEVTKFTDRTGVATGFTYHPQSGLLASITNANGQTTKFTYTAYPQNFTSPIDQTPFSFTFYNLTSVEFPDKSQLSYSYDGKGNLLTCIDPAGKVWTYTYNARGQILTSVNPAGGELRYTYNADGTVASAQDSDTGSTTYGYDPFRRVNRITRPDGKFVQIVYDEQDRITSMTDENGHQYSFEYDANGNLKRIINPKGYFRQNDYDLMDRRIRSTDPLGKATTFGFDNRGRLGTVTDPNGLTTTLGYEPRGWLNRITRGGQTWRRGHDNEGVIKTRTTPLNHTASFQTDKLGLLVGVTDALGHAGAIKRDELNRIIEMTDPEGRTTNYKYDSRGDLSEASQPVTGTATYERNDLGLLSRLTDPNGAKWEFGYTDMGRLDSHTDPLGNTWSHTHDSHGRLSQTTYPDGSTLTRSYDGAGNLTRKSYSGGPDQQFTYDELDRRTGATGISFIRDKAGRITSTADQGTVFGAGYDDGGRLKTATYNNNALTVTYTYDAVTGLLSRVTDSLTNARIDFAADNDGRLIGITRSNGVNATITWDEADRLTRIQDGSFLDLNYTFDPAGQITEVRGQMPLDPASLLAAGTSSFTYDAASRISNAGYVYDKRGRLTASPGHNYAWDNSSALVQIDSATLTCNGMGQVRTRTQGGQTTRFYYNHAVGLAPVVAEKDDAGQFLRYYVWTPAGSLLYMIDATDGNKVYFYHFDVTGSTLALTSSAGAVTDKYAYDPFGVLLAHEGNSLQPFTFVGQLGIRQEIPGGTLYNMRARYYDARTQRFVSRDPVWPQTASPSLLNPYQYAANSPLSYVDPTGKVLLPAWLSWLARILNWASGTPTGSPVGDPEWGRFGSPIGSDEELYKRFREGRQPINEGEKARIHAYQMTQLEKAKRDQWRAEDEEALRKAGMSPEEAAAFMNWLEKAPLGAMQKQREFEFALALAGTKSKRESIEKPQKPLKRREPPPTVDPCQFLALCFVSHFWSEVMLDAMDREQAYYGDYDRSADPRDLDY
ncbi:MAG: RHS repeat-associated core domain-containing protein [Acidobacteriota bacterium]